MRGLFILVWLLAPFSIKNSPPRQCQNCPLQWAIELIILFFHTFFMATVEKYTPTNLLTDHSLTHLLIDLVLNGYTLLETQTYDPLQTITEEYEYPDSSSHVFVMRDEERIPGTVVILEWTKHSPQTEESLRFWETLSQELTDTQLLQTLESLNILEVAGIVTSLKERNKGVGKGLFTSVIETFKPALVMGQTKNPAAALVRMKVFREAGYRTFLGEYELTNEGIEKTTVQLPFMAAYAAAHNLGTPQPEGIIYPFDEYGITPDVPDVSTFPEYIQQAFLPIIEAQKRVGESTTIYAPLITIKADLLAHFDSQ